MLGGEIINADSRQLYRHMPIITAMPTADEFAAVPHHLFDMLEPDEAFSVGDYMQQAGGVAENLVQAGKVPVFVGGTGFYLEALLHGISPIPPTPPKLQQALNKRLNEEGLSSLVQELRQVDPAIAGEIDTPNPHRVVRALAVCQATGKPMSDWQKLPKEGALPYRFINIAIAPPREVLLQRIESRFEIMLEEGLLDEMEALKQKNFTLNHEAMTSLGIKEFFAYLDGHITLNQAKEKTLTHMRRYAKRQMTWLRQRYGADRIFEAGDSKKILPWLEKQLKEQN